MTARMFAAALAPRAAVIRKTEGRHQDHSRGGGGKRVYESSRHSFDRTFILQRSGILDSSTHLTAFKVVLWYNKSGPWRIGLKSYFLKDRECGCNRDATKDSTGAIFSAS